MLSILLILLLLSNSITLRRDKSILYSRATITILIVSIFILYDNLYFLFLDKGIRILGGLFHSTSTTAVFHIFILTTSVICLLTSVYPRKVWLKKRSSMYRLLFINLIYYQTIILNKMREQFKIIEYSLIILFMHIRDKFVSTMFMHILDKSVYTIFILILDKSVSYLIRFITRLLRDRSLYFLIASASTLVLSTYITHYIGYFLVASSHYCFIFLFLYSQKHNISIKKLIILFAIVFITPLILHLLIFIMPCLLDNLPFIVLEFHRLTHRIIVLFCSKILQVLLKIFNKKGFIDIFTNICIAYVIRVLLLGSLSIFDIVSNIFITNCLFSLTIDFYSITLIKVLIPYVEKLYTSIIWPCFNCCFPVIHCDSPEQIAKLFAELPFSNVDNNDMVTECRTSTNYKTREDLRAEFKEFRLKISLYTPSTSISKQSVHESNSEINESSGGQLDKGKKRALDNTEEVYNKRAKIDLGNTTSSTITLADFDFDNKTWDLNTIYEKINNLMEDTNYHWSWKINKLFESKDIQTNFYNYIEDSSLTTKAASRNTLPQLKAIIEEKIKTEFDPYSIKEEDFTKDGLNFFNLFNKLKKIMAKEDFNSKWKITKLKFEPYTLKSPFIDRLKACNLYNSIRISDLSINTLKNLVGERLTLVLFTSPNSITWDCFTKDGLHLESVYNKIKQSVEDGQYQKQDTINKLFPPGSQIGKLFYTRLQTLNLTNVVDLPKVSGIKIVTLINSLEKVVNVPSTQNNSITREDLIGEHWNLYSIYEKITNVISTDNFNRASKIGKLEFEPPILKRAFYNYIKVFKLTEQKWAADTRIVNLRNTLKRELELPDN